MEPIGSYAITLALTPNPSPWGEGSQIQSPSPQGEGFRVRAVRQVLQFH
jgi:hypothetical protein